MKTFAQDHTQPALPLPELRDTCDAIADLVAPLVDKETFAVTMKAVTDFASSGGSGERLQSLLSERKDSMPGNASWLRPFWDDMYLAWRDPLPINMNYAFRFNEERWGGGDEALARLVHALGAILDRLHAGELEPERTRGGFQSMEQALSCVYTRIPGHGTDALLQVGPGGCRSIAVTCNGYWFVLPLSHGDGGRVSVTALREAFGSIRLAAGEMEPAPPVAAMTAAPRSEAATLRAELCARLQNRLCLSALEHCLFAVSLDSEHASDADMILRLIAGDAANRWFDKSLQLIATENGGLGANFEHAGCDAAIWVYLLGQADAILANGDAEGAAETPGRGAAYRLLRFDIDSDMETRLEAARADFAIRASTLDIECRDFSEFARESLKGLGTSPDAFLQVAFQLAQHHLFGRLRSSYEAVAVRTFAQGRTECARGSTAEALALAQAAKKPSDDGLLELYKAAEGAHKIRMTRCQRALGVERHMYGLHAMYVLYGTILGMESAPAVFSDPGWLALKHDALSTSGIGAPFIRFFGFGPVVEDGYGLGYSPSADSTGLVVTSFKGKSEPAHVLMEAFAGAASRLADILRSAKVEEKG